LVSGDVEPGAEGLADHFAGGEVVGLCSGGECCLELRIKADGDDRRGGGAEWTAAASAAEGRDVVAPLRLLGKG
jgi:hypothetical protein